MKHTKKTGIGTKKILTPFNVGLFLLFAVIAVLRFWNIGKLFFFGIDEEYSSLLAKTIIEHFHILWIGLSAANTGYYIGPGMIYVHAFLLRLSGLDPQILAYAASTIGVVNAAVLYLVGKTYFGKKTAWIATAIYSLSWFTVSYDRRFWNSSMIPLAVLLMFTALARTYKNPRWLIAVFMLLGLFFHIHASLFIFIPVIIACLILFRKKKIKFDAVTVIGSAIGFLVFYFPLIVFDLVHNFDNLKTPLRMIASFGKSGGGGNLLLQHAQVLLSTFNTFWIGQDNGILIQIVFILLSLGIIGLFIRKKQTDAGQILSVIALAYLIMFVVYPGKILDYYFIGFFPFFAIMVGNTFEKIPGKILIPYGFIIAMYVCAIMISQPVNQGLTAKKVLISRVMEKLGNRSYELNTTHDYLYFGGWRYLFSAYGRTPAKSQADSMFGWIYQKEISDSKPQATVIVSDSPIKTGKNTIEVHSGIYYAEIKKD